MTATLCICSFPVKARFVRKADLCAWTMMFRTVWTAVKVRFEPFAEVVAMSHTD